MTLSPLPSPVWYLDLSTSPAAKAGLRSLLSADPSVQPWRTDLRQPTFSSASATPADALTHQPPAPNVLVVAMAADTLAINEAVTTWDMAGLLMLGGDPMLAYTLDPGRPVAILSLEIEPASLIAAVRAVASGLTVVEPNLLDPERGILAGLPNPISDRTHDVLTPREHEVLALVANGLPNKTIAMELGISEHTAKFHVGSLLTKLGAASRTEAVTIAARRGILII